MAKGVVRWKPRVMGDSNGELVKVMYAISEAVLHRESWTLIESVELEPRIRAPLSSTMRLGMGMFYTWSCCLRELIRHPGAYPVLLYIPPRQNVLCSIAYFPIRVGQPWVEEEFEQSPPDLILRYSLTEPPPSLIC